MSHDRDPSFPCYRFAGGNSADRWHVSDRYTLHQHHLRTAGRAVDTSSHRRKNHALVRNSMAVHRCATRYKGMSL